jgi:hypothetical protein
MRNVFEKWKEKVHPLFLEWAEIYKEMCTAISTLGPNPASELTKKIRSHAEKGLAQLTGKLSNELRGKYIITLGCTTEDEEFFAWLCWRRFRKPLWKLVQEEWDGSVKAAKNLVRLREDWQQLGRGQKLKPFKGHLDHHQILEVGLSLGLEKLTAEELADCFDRICPCGETHDADAMKKQRARVSKEVQTARSLMKDPSPFIQNVLAAVGAKPSAATPAQRSDAEHKHRTQN